MNMSLAKKSDATPPRPQTLLDRVAIGLAALCVVHCVATLLLLATVASIGSVFADPIVHEIGLAIAVVLAAVAFAIGYRRHRQRIPLKIGLTGLALMTAALFAPHGWPEFGLSLSGLVLVIYAHWRNMRG